MRQERISSNVPRQTRLRVKAAAQTLGLSESKFIEQAVNADLDNLDVREALKTQQAETEKLTEQRDSARTQRDTFKARYEETQESLAVAEAKIDALQNRGLFARIFNSKGVTRHQ